MNGRRHVRARDRRLYAAVLVLLCAAILARFPSDTGGVGRGPASASSRVESAVADELSEAVRSYPHAPAALELETESEVIYLLCEAFPSPHPRVRAGTGTAELAGLLSSWPSGRMLVTEGRLLHLRDGALDLVVRIRGGVPVAVDPAAPDRVIPGGLESFLASLPPDPVGRREATVAPVRAVRYSLRPLRVRGEVTGQLLRETLGPSGWSMPTIVTLGVRRVWLRDAASGGVRAE